MEDDLSLIRPLTPKDTTIDRPVSVNHFQKAGRHLYFINARHQTGRNSITCQMIRIAFVFCPLDLVIIEGIRTEDGFSPAEPIREALRDFPRVRENEYAAYWADKNKVPFIGGEPSSKFIFTEMAEKEYTKRKEKFTTHDVMAFYVLRDIPHKWPKGIGDEMVLINYVNDRLLINNPDFSHIPAADRLTYEGFKEWYNQHKGNRPDILKRIPSIPPFDEKNSDWLERLNAKLMHIRTRHRCSLIAKSLDTYKRILVVYGDSHLVVSRPVLDKMFGRGDPSGLFRVRRRPLQPSPRRNFILANKPCAIT
jgi:hypothetical protein